mmetsp:Transcript_21671/g.60844  ORF Transcript_21671/g.60844 Transcript_21671/m.60844 type:complete len:208 (+) Transcript_21671:51-674(+)
MCLYTQAKSVQAFHEFLTSFPFALQLLRRPSRERAWRRFAVMNSSRARSSSPGSLPLRRKTTAPMACWNSMKFISTNRVSYSSSTCIVMPMRNATPALRCWKSPSYAPAASSSSSKLAKDTQVLLPDATTRPQELVNTACRMPKCSLKTSSTASVWSAARNARISSTRARPIGASARSTRLRASCSELQVHFSMNRWRATRSRNSRN